MFGNFKAMTALANLMRDKSQALEAAEKLKQQLDDLRVEGVSGGGACRVTVTGRMRVEKVELSPALASAMADAASLSQAQELIAEATNEGAARAQARVEEMVRASLSDLGLEDLMDDMKSIGPIGELMG